MGPVLEGKDKLGHLKPEVLAGHPQTGRNESLMQKRYQDQRERSGTQPQREQEATSDYSEGCWERFNVQG